MRRAGSVAERTENAAVARVRTQAREAAGADEEVHASVLRHFCLRIQAAHRTCERSRLHTPLSVELISNDNRALRRTSGVTSNIRAWDCAFSRGHRAVDLSQHGAVHQDALPGCPSPLQRNRTNRHTHHRQERVTNRRSLRDPEVQQSSTAASVLGAAARRVHYANVPATLGMLGVSTSSEPARRPRPLMNP
jgi:hypothetical protein